MAVLPFWLFYTVWQRMAKQYLVVWNCKTLVNMDSYGTTNDGSAKSCRVNEGFLLKLTVWTLFYRLLQTLTSDRFTPFGREGPCFRMTETEVWPLGEIYASFDSLYGMAIVGQTVQIVSWSSLGLNCSRRQSGGFTLFYAKTGKTVIYRFTVPNTAIAPGQECRILT